MVQAHVTWTLRCVCSYGATGIETISSADWVDIKSNYPPISGPISTASYFPRFDIACVCEQKLAARKCEFAGFGPALVATEATKLDAEIVYSVLANLVRHNQTVSTGALPCLFGGPFDVLAELTYAFKKCSHGRIETAMQEADAERKV